MIINCIRDNKFIESFSASGEGVEAKRPRENSHHDSRASPELKRRISRSTDNRSEKKWLDKRDRIKQLFLGCNSRDGCSPMRIQYWKEFIPVQIGEMTFHQYPGTSLDQQWWQLSHTQNYDQFIKSRMLSEPVNLSKNNVIYFNRLEIEDFKPTFESGLILKKGKIFKNKKYIYVYNRVGDLLIAQKHITPMGRIQHSSLAQGFPVKSAGWLTFDEKGNLTEISNFSGHYLISKYQVNRTLTYLKEHQIPIQEVRVFFSTKGTVDDYACYTMEEWQAYLLQPSTGKSS